MTPPRLYDVDETAPLVRMSKSWLYRHAGVTIPVTRVAGSRRLFWTAAQIEQIIRDGAQHPKAKPPAPQDPAPMRRRTSRSESRNAGAAIPQARPERSRRYRPDGAA